jgi:hypothetical protein
LLNHTASLADCVAPARPVPDSLIKHGARRVDTVAGVQQALDALIVFRPQFDFVEVPLVRVVPIGRRLCREVAWRRRLLC